MFTCVLILHESKCYFRLPVRQPDAKLIILYLEFALETKITIGEGERKVYEIFISKIDEVYQSQSVSDAVCILKI